MGIAYNEWDNRTDTIVAGIKQKVLASSDWAHLQLTTGTQNTTLSSGASAGATSISTAATIPSGSYVTIGNGAANPEVRLTTAVSGSGPFAVSWNAAEPLVNSYSSSAAVGVGSYIKATTTRGAQMVIDLAGTAPDTQAVKPIIYQSHDGTTAGNSLQRYVYFKRNAGAATNILHCRCSVAKDWIYVDVEGPRASETGADNSTVGSFRSCLYLGDVVPYDGADTTPVVVAVGGITGSTGDSSLPVRVSRNRDNTISWVLAQLRTLGYPTYNTAITNGNFTAVAKNGDFVQAPWVALEISDGMRGRLQYLHFGGIFGIIVDANDVPSAQPGAEMIYGSYKYRALLPFRTDGNAFQSYAFGAVSNTSPSTMSPVLWVPVAAYP